MTPQMCGFLSGMLPLIVFFSRIGLTAPAEERDGLLALLPIYVAGGTFFMILHLNTTALTKWADADTDRHTANVFDLLGASQDALPSYFRNAGPDVPRPVRESLVVVEPRLARMFGTSRIDAATVLTVRQAHPELTVVATAGEFAGLTIRAEKPLDRRAANVYPDGSVTVKEAPDSHGVPTIVVDVAEGVERTARVAFVRQVGDREIPVLLVDQKVFDDVYRRADANTPKLPPGSTCVSPAPRSSRPRTPSA